MKKILTLLIAFGTVAAVHAQTSRDEARRVILGQPKSGNYPSDSRDVILGGNNPNNYPNNYPNGGSSVDQINREYNYRIEQVRNNRYISRAEKERQIRALEREREMRIRELNRQYNGNYSRNNGNYRHNNGNYGRNNDYDRHDNGKHLGWEKGVGNPHRNGGNPGHGNGKNKDHDRDDD